MLTKKMYGKKRNTFTSAGGEAKKLIRERERDRKHLLRSKQDRESEWYRALRLYCWLGSRTAHYIYHPIYVNVKSIQGE